VISRNRWSFRHRAVTPRGQLLVIALDPVNFHRTIYSGHPATGRTRTVMSSTTVVYVERPEWQPVIGCRPWPIST
jgi:hypothetical protein